MNRGRRYINAPPNVGRLLIGLDFVCPYLVALLELELFITRSGGFIADLFMCTPRLAVSGSRMARYFLMVVHIMTNLGILFPFW